VSRVLELLVVFKSAVLQTKLVVFDSELLRANALRKRIGASGEVDKASRGRVFSIRRVQPMRVEGAQPAMPRRPPAPPVQKQRGY